MISFIKSQNLFLWLCTFVRRKSMLFSLGTCVIAQSYSQICYGKTNTPSIHTSAVSLWSSHSIAFTNLTLTHDIPNLITESQSQFLTYESVDEILWCDHSTESYWTVLSCGTVYYAVQGGSNFWVCGWNPMMWPFKWNLFSSTFTWYYLFSM